MCGHPLGNNIKFHPPLQRNPSDSDLAGHEERLVLLIPYIIKQIVGWDLPQKDLLSVLHAKGCNYPAYEANFQGFGLSTWIDGEPLPGL